jgi:hypothetical protein
MKFIIRLITAALLLAALAAAQSSIPKVEVQFNKGATSKTIKGQIKGDDSFDYVVHAAAGQIMTVSLATRNTFTYFNVIPPGEENVAIYNSSTTGEKYEGTLPSTGDYKIRVYLMRAAARRGATAVYSLTVALTGKPVAASDASPEKP